MAKRGRPPGKRRMMNFRQRQRLQTVLDKLKLLHRNSTDLFVRDQLGRALKDLQALKAEAMQSRQPQSESASAPSPCPTSQ